MESAIRILLRTSLICLLLQACGGGSSSSTTVINLPAPPANLTVTSHDGYTRLQWDPVGNATAYNIYWSSQSGVNKTNGNKISQQQNTLNHGALINGQTYYYVIAAENSGGEGGISSEVTGNPVTVSGGDDPLYTDQWHLDNTAFADEDINVVLTWNSCGTGNTCRGEGIRVAVVDDGLEIDHPDLLANIASGFSYNYLTGSSDPTPFDPDNAHGTSVAGIIAARDYNNIGVRGVAPRANLVAYNLLTYFTNSTEADAMTRGNPDVQISSNSWGPEDNTGELFESNLSWRTAINSGLNNGRNGLGTIYVFAAGNGGQTVDNSNYDGYANYRGVIAVTALNDRGVNSIYSEPGANILISAPGGEFCNGSTAITTTDLTGTTGSNTNSTTNDYTDKDYTKCMNGTSAATPMVSGAVALMLQANPNLGWRDVRYILATTAKPNNLTDPTGWEQNAGNPSHLINHKYGFGALDTDAAVIKAKGWVNLGPQLTFEANKQVGETIPDLGQTPLEPSIINISNSGIAKIEAVEVTFSAADHPYAADLEVILTRPAPVGTQSVLAQTHTCNEWNGNSYVPLAQCSSSYDNWVFTTVRHLDESADGDWTLTVKDGAGSDTGTFQSWKLKIYGRGP